VHGFVVFAIIQLVNKAQLPSFLCVTSVIQEHSVVEKS